MKVTVSYPTPQEEKEMLDREILAADRTANGQSSGIGSIERVATLDDLKALQSLCHRIYVDDRVKRYIINLVWATRKPAEYKLPLENLIELGASPRASLSLLAAARAEALLSGEHYVGPQMVKAVAPDVLRHRIILSYEAEAQNKNADEIVRMILDGVEVP